MNDHYANEVDSLTFYVSTEGLSDKYTAIMKGHIPTITQVREENEPVGIDRVIFNDPATIVIWMDGTKTVVKAHNEKYDPEKGLAMAIAKKYFGNKGNYFNHLRPWLEKEEKDRRNREFDQWLEELGKEYE